MCSASLRNSCCSWRPPVSSRTCMRWWPNCPTRTSASWRTSLAPGPVWAPRPRPMISCLHWRERQIASPSALTWTRACACATLSLPSSWAGPTPCRPRQVPWGRCCMTCRCRHTAGLTGSWWRKSCPPCTVSWGSWPATTPQPTSRLLQHQWSPSASSKIPQKRSHAQSRSRSDCVAENVLSAWALQKADRCLPKMIPD